MKTLLFTQMGDARPKCTGGVHPRSGVVTEAKLGERWCKLTMTQKRAVATADRWWLVGGTNADDGRVVILQEQVFTPELKRTLGRILASGGRTK